MRRSFARSTRATTALVISILVLWTFAPAVSADNGLEVTTPYPAVAVAPGTKVSFDLTVDSTRAANVSLALSGVPEGWTASLLGGGFVVDAVAVTPGTAAEVRLDVDVPADAAAGTSTLRLTARGGGAQDVLPIADPGRRRGGRRHHADDVHADPDRRVGRGLHLRPAAQERHGPGRDGVRLGERARGLGRRGHADRRDAGRLDGRRGRRHARTSGSPPTPRTTSRPAPIPITVEAHAGERTIPAELGIEVTGLLLDDALDTERRAVGERLGRVAHDPGVRDHEHRHRAAHRGDAHRRPRRRTGRSRPTRRRSPSIAPGATQAITATITPSGEAVAGDYVITFNAAAAEEARRGQQPGPLHRRDLAALGARRPGPDRADRRPASSTSSGPTGADERQPRADRAQETAGPPARGRTDDARQAAASGIDAPVGHASASARVA